jgi:hypothetical protein
VPQEIVNSVSDTEKRRQEAINEVIYTERDLGAWSIFEMYVSYAFFIFRARAKVLNIFFLNLGLDESS